MKRIKTVSAEKPRFAAEDKVWKKFYPSLLAFLTDGEYDVADGGGPRELGLITIWAGAGVFSAKLRDNDSGHCCYVTGESLEQLLLAADAVCSDPGGGWKPDPGAAQRRKK